MLRSSLFDDTSNGLQTNSLKYNTGDPFVEGCEMNGWSMRMYIAQTDRWYLERITVLIAGIIILFSVILAWIHSSYWLVITLIVGVNEIMFALIGVCLTSNILYALGAKPRLMKR